MKKLILNSLVLFAVVLSSCSDDETKSKVKNETPLNTYMKTLEAGSVEEYSDGDRYSVGYSFRTKKAGQITALGMSAPQPGTYTVLLYDSLTGDLLETADVVLTEEQIEENPYGFQYTALEEPVTTIVDQAFFIVYDMNSGEEDIYRPIIEPFVFQMEGSAIEFQGGVWGFAGEGTPDNMVEEYYYTADVKFKF